VSTTVLITAYNRPKMVHRALASVYAQTLEPGEIVIVDDSAEPDEILELPVDGVRYVHTGRSRARSCYLSWYDGIERASGDLVAILHDDDWYEPTFLERTAAMMADDVGYVFTEAKVHRDGGIFSNWNYYWGETQHHHARAVGDAMLKIAGVISPSCVLYRRADLLRCLYPGNVPGLPIDTSVACGPDMLMALMPLLDWPLVGWINEPLVNFEGHAGSTTIAEMAKDGGHGLQDNYRAARQFFYSMRQLREVLR